MRFLLALPLPFLAAACWTPGPGQIDPTRYPWDQRYPGPGTYCIVSLELPNSSGIAVGSRADAAHLACKVQPARRP